jgi:hypothetical protein
MGNCSGFCMTSNSDESQPKKVTADKVKSALVEKEELFKEGVNYENAYGPDNSRGGFKARKL